MRKGREERGRVRLTAAEARGHLEAWRRSGWTLTAYARSVGMSFQRLHRWRRKLEVAGAAGVGFVPVRIVGGSEEQAAGRQETGFELVSRGGLRLRVGADFDEVGLERLLRVMGRAAC